MQNAAETAGFIGLISTCKWNSVGLDILLQENFFCLLFDP